MRTRLGLVVILQLRRFYVCIPSKWDASALVELVRGAAVVAEPSLRLVVDDPIASPTA